MQGKALQDFIVDKIDDHVLSNRHDVTVRRPGADDHAIGDAGFAFNINRDDVLGFAPMGVKGINASDWVVVDLGEIIVHVMQEESRQLYELEKLWS